MNSWFYLTLEPDPYADLVFRFKNTALYKQNETMSEIYDTTRMELSDKKGTLKTAFLNTFIDTADEQGVLRMERIYNIIPDLLKDSLEFRKIRLKNAMSMMLPYTRIFLLELLDSKLGKGSYFISIEYDIYTIHLDIIEEQKEQFQYVIDAIQDIIPANMVLDAGVLERFLHRYLNKNYTYGEMEQYTYGYLSQFATT